MQPKKDSVILYFNPYIYAYPLTYYYSFVLPDVYQRNHDYSPYFQELWSADCTDRMGQTPLTFVLVHGAWANSDFWDGIAAELRTMGHNVHTPETPGHGIDNNLNVTHDMYDRAVTNYIISNNLNHVVLVGHSFGGTIVQKVAELVPDRLKRLVFFNAFVLNDGQSAFEEVPPSFQQLSAQLAQSSGNNTVKLPFPIFRETFSNLGSLEQAKAIYENSPAEPAKPLLEKLDLKTFYTLNIPKSYVYLTEDNVLPQDNMQYGWHPHMSSRLGLFRLIKGHGDHMTTAYFNPKYVAHRLYEAGRD